MTDKSSCMVEYLVVFIILILFSFATFDRNQVWKDELSFWSDVVKKSTNKARPYNNLGRAYLTKKSFLQAIPYLKEALRLNPYFSYAHYNLGISYQGIGLYDEALNEYKKALYGTPKPYFADVHNNMGVCYFEKGWTDLAIKEFKQALNINPDFSDAHFNLAFALNFRVRGNNNSR